MKKSVKIIFIIVIILLSIILIDTIQAKLFNNRPVLKIIESYNGGNVLQKDNGVFVYTYNFSNGRKKTVFRWERYAPPLEKSSDVQDENANNITWEEITENGVNEEILINNLDTELLTQIAKKLYYISIYAIIRLFILDMIFFK